MAIASSPRSPYYPPRARWYSPALNAADRMAHLLALDRLRLSFAPQVDLLPLLGAFFVPGLGVWLRWPGMIGRAAVAAAAFLLLTFFVFLGQPVDNLVFGMLLSLHSSGFVYYCTPLIDQRLSNRIIFTLASLVAILVLVYLPAQALLQNYLFAPMQMKGRVIVVGHIYSTKGIRAGDWVAYSVPEFYVPGEGGVLARSGVDLAPVLAAPGDRVQFFADSYRVNGVAHPKLPNMPSTGSVQLQQKEWFVWPNLAIEFNHMGRTDISENFVHMARVNESQLIGKPLRHWFWRRQVMP